MNSVVDEYRRGKDADGGENKLRGENLPIVKKEIHKRPLKTPSI